MGVRLGFLGFVSRAVMKQHEANGIFEQPPFVLNPRLLIKYSVDLVGLVSPHARSQPHPNPLHRHPNISAPLTLLAINTLWSQPLHSYLRFFFKYFFFLASLQLPHPPCFQFVSVSRQKKVLTQIGYSRSSRHTRMYTITPRSRWSFPSLYMTS